MGEGTEDFSSELEGSEETGGVEETMGGSSLPFCWGWREEVDSGLSATASFSTKAIFESGEAAPEITSPGGGYFFAPEWIEPNPCQGR